MRKRATNLDRLCDVLNELGIRTTNVTPTSRRPSKPQIEKARRRSLKEITRISGNAKRLTSG